MSKETAEQKLLKIIEGSDAQKAAAAVSSKTIASVQEVAASVKASGLPSFSIPDFIQSIKDLMLGKKTDDKTPGKFGLRELNRVLITVIIICCIVLVKNFTSGVEFSKQEIDLAVDNQIARLSENLLPKAKEVSQYILSMAKRNIFQPFEEKEEVVITDADVPIKKIEEKTKDLKLVGISWLDSPESASALIENTTSGVTYFLKTGEKINSVTIKEIYADAVILVFEEEEMEFRL